MRMNRLQIFLLGLAATVVGVAAYQVGERMPSIAQDNQQLELTRDSASQSVRPASAYPDAVDLSKVTIVNVGSLGFDQVFDLLSTADAQLREKWAHQLEQMEFGPRKRAALAAFYKALAELNPGAAIQLILSCKDQATREMAIRSAIAAASPSAMPQMAKMLEQLPAQELSGHNDVVVAWWSMTDPLGASHFIEANSAHIASDSYYVLLRNWVQLDGFAAQSWLDGRHLDKDKAIKAFQGLVTGLVERDQSAALNYVMAHATDENFAPALATAGREFFIKSPDGARAMILGLPNEAAREAALQQIATMYGSDWIAEWKQTPDAIAKWLVSLPPETFAGNIGPAIHAWDEADRTSFRLWLNQLPVESRNVVAAGFCSGASEEHLSETIVIGESITESALRERVLQQAVERSGKTRAELSELLRGLAITPTQRAAVENFAPEE